MTKEEFIGIAADALMKHYGVTDETEPDYLVPCVEAAEAVLDAVGAWECREACLRTIDTLTEGDLDFRAPRLLRAIKAAIAKAERRS